MSRPRRRLLPRRRGTDPADQGSALLVVMVMMTILAVFASVGLTYAVNTLRVVDRSEDNAQALSAAEAGVADYLARLNKSEEYWKKVDCTNPALKGPLVEANSCGWGSSTPTGWLTVPGAPRSTFHYEVSTASTYTRGSILLTSTGKVGSKTRTVQVTLRRGGFGEFLYYTVYETTDPANQVVYSDTAQAQKVCSRYWWANPSRPTYDREDRTGCPDINFVSGDVFKGPVHTNDALVVNGTPSFQGTVTTSYPRCKAVDGTPPPNTSCYRYDNASADRPTFSRGIAYRPEVTLSDTIGELRQYVDPAQTPNPGCLYTGPTRIKFLPTAGSATPQMRVWSKWTAAAQLNPGCGTTSTLQSTEGALLNVPKENLVYVQDVPSGQSSPASNDCKTTGKIGDNLPLMSNASQGLYEFDMYLADANCRYGTAYVEGTLKGRVTLSTDNNIIVTGDLLYSGGESGTDSLGLIAKNSVKVYHPMKVTCETSNCSRYSLSEMNRPGSTKFTNPTIYAAIQTLQHSFTVQSYSEGGPLGTLKVFGCIAQRYRGPVGTGSATQVSTGYVKDYTYDTRLRYAPPPYFLDPVRSGWGQKTFGEVQARYKP